MSLAMWHLIGIAVYLKMIFNPGFADKADLNIFWYWIIGLSETGKARDVFYVHRLVVRRCRHGDAEKTAP